MMKQLLKSVRCILFFSALAVCATGCGSDAFSAWETDFDIAKENAQSANKNILVFFSTDDAQGVSDDLKKNVFAKKKFVSAVSPDFTLLNIAVTESEYTESQNNTAEKSAFQKKLDILDTYSVETMPALYMLTKEGFVIKAFNYDPAVNSVAHYVELLGGEKENAASYNSLVRAVEESQGVYRVRAINALFDATEESYRALLLDYCREVSSLDPDNTTGLVGKFEFQTAYSEAIELFHAGNAEDAAKCFVDAVLKGHLSSAQIQEAYYNASYILAMSKTYDARVLDYLKLSYESLPEGEEAENVKRTIEAVESMLKNESEQKGNN
mgnify:CR=1 FL=1